MVRGRHDWKDTMELEIAQAASTMPFIVINGICFLIASATAAVMCVPGLFASASSPRPVLGGVGAFD